MPKYSVIKDNEVINIIVADSKESAELLTKEECIQINEDFPYGVGSKFDGTVWKTAYELQIENESNGGENA